MLGDRKIVTYHSERLDEFSEREYGRFGSYFEYASCYRVVRGFASV